MAEALEEEKDNMRKESLSNDECASAVDLTLFPEVKIIPKSRC